MKKDLIIGAYTNYNWDTIKYWVNSLDNSGFTGDKVVITYNSHSSTVNELVNRGYTVQAFSRDANGHFVYPNNFIIVVTRFVHLWNYIDNLPNINDYRYVITTDMKDVIFQSNPSTWLENNIADKKICASSESLKYEHEAWGADNFQGSYPELWNFMKSKTIWNCGVQAGDIQTMKDLWLQIYLTCSAGKRHNPDQAAYNLLLNLEPWKSITRYTPSEDGWAAQLGTTMDQSKINNFKPFLLEPVPTIKNDCVTTSDGKLYPIVHQWDRVDNLKNIIMTKFK